MKNNKKFKLLSILAGLSIMAIITLFDLVTKQIATVNLMGRPNKRIIKYILEFSYIENSGAAFGILSGQKLLFMFLTFIALGAFGYFFAFVDFKKKKVYTSALIFMIAGTLGNAIDRISYGYVIDFISFPFIDKFIGLMKIPSFICNIADIYLTVGIILILIDLIFFERKRKKGKDKSDVILKDEKNAKINDEKNNEDNIQE